MWYLWTTLLLVSSTLVAAAGTVEVDKPAAAGTEKPAPVPASTRAPHRTLDRQAAELAWRTWLQSPESGNPNAPPRRITTKSLFITPLVCPKGQRLDRNGCVQVVTVNKDEHERILLEQLNALFTSAPSGDVVYDYGDEDPGPLQLTIPIGLEPQAAPLQGQEPTPQAHETQPNDVNVEKKDKKPETDLGIEAELEILKLQHSHNINDTASSEGTDVLNHNLLPPLDKPKRNSPVGNSTETDPKDGDEGQKEIVYGNVNVDPVLVDTEYQNQELTSTEAEVEAVTETEKANETPVQNNATDINSNTNENTNKSFTKHTDDDDANKTTTEIIFNSTMELLKKDGDQTKLNPENDYADIGEAIKLISRYAEVTTDDSFSKDQKKYAMKDDSILGTRTRLQNRRNKPKSETEEPSSALTSSDYMKNKMPVRNVQPKNEAYYRYPWRTEHSPTPPPDYPFRHLQDYWPDRNHIGGVYNTHENPKRHHHTYPHNYFRPHGFPYTGYPYIGPHETYSGQLQAFHRAAALRSRPMRSHSNNQELYSLLGLRHWFSSEGTSKR